MKKRVKLFLASVAAGVIALLFTCNSCAPTIRYRYAITPEGDTIQVRERVIYRDAYPYYNYPYYYYYPYYYSVPVYKTVPRTTPPANVGRRSMGSGSVNSRRR